MGTENAAGQDVPSIDLLEIARLILQTKAIRQAAQNVVEEWESGIITTKEGYGCGGLTIACLRDTLGGYVPDDIMEEISNDRGEHERK